MQTLIERASKAVKKAAFLHALEEELLKLAVSEDEALAAADTLSQHRPVSRYLTSAGLGAVAVPTTKAIGRAVEGGLAAAPGQRAAGALKAVLTRTGPELAREVTEGALGGGAVRAVGEGLDVARARHTALKFLRDRQQPEQKAAALVNPAVVTDAAASAARAGSVGRFKGLATTNSLKPPGPVSTGVINPRQSIKSSVTPPR